MDFDGDVNTEGFDDRNSGPESARAGGRATRSRLDPGSTHHSPGAPVNPFVA